MEAYKLETIKLIRIESPKLSHENYSDKHIAELYREWSTLTACAGWLSPSPNYISSFIKWATTPPCDLYEN